MNNVARADRALQTILAIAHSAFKNSSEVMVLTVKMSCSESDFVGGAGRVTHQAVYSGCAGRRRRRLLHVEGCHCRLDRHSDDISCNCVCNDSWWPRSVVLAQVPLRHGLAIAECEKIRLNFVPHPLFDLFRSLWWFCYCARVHATPGVCARGRSFDTAKLEIHCGVHEPTYVTCSRQKATT